MILSLSSIAIILLIGILVFLQMYNNTKVNELIIEKCFDNFDKVEEVVIKKDGFWSPVICEKIT